MILAILIILLAIIIGYFFVGFPKTSEDIVWGVNFSQIKAARYDADWPGYYLAILDDLKVKNIKLASYWSIIEPEEGNYNFESLDWQIEEAEKRGVELILVIGRKTPGWPECHIPDWARSKTKKEQQERILKLLENIVNRYKDRKAIKYWQVENEPFFPFGKCLWKDKKFLKKEIELVKSLDPSRKIIISESGEFPLWLKAAYFGDILGITMYKKAWFEELGLYISYPFPPTFYSRKASLIKALFKKDIMCIELQAEPWGAVLNYKLSLEEQEKTMSFEQFKKIISFAKKTSLKRFYLWGSEWWYWMKTKNNRPEFWEEAKKLFL